MSRAADGRSATTGSPPERPDLRLAATAVGCWLSALGALAGTATTGFVVAGAAAVAALVTSAVALVASGAAGVRRTTLRPTPPHRADRRWIRYTETAGWVTTAAMLGVVIGASVTAARVSGRDAQPVAGLARGHAVVRLALTVSDDPRPVRATGGGPSTLAVAARLVWVEPEPAPAAPPTAADRPVPPPGATARRPPPRTATSAQVLVLASGPGWRELLPGQRVTAVGRLSPARGGDLRAAVFSVSTAPVAVGRPSWPQRAAGSLRAGLRRACAPLPPEPGGLLPGLVVGDTSGLDPALADDFRATGMTHLVAVSGSNCALVVGAVLLLARWCRAGPRMSALVCALALAGFVILVRPSPSVVRAAAMGALALLALGLGRPRATVPALAAVVVALIVFDPGLASDIGFALSVLATAGLVLLAPTWAARLRRRRVPRGLAESLAVPAAAQVACAPVIAAISAGVSLTAVPANLLAVPAIAPTTMVGVAATLVSVVWPTGAAYLAWLASWPARWLVWLARTGASAPGGLVPWPGGASGGLLLAAVLLAVLGIARIGLVRRFAVVVLLSAAVGALPVRIAASGWPPPRWFVVACDVGQGDALVLPAGPGTAIVVDAGPLPGPIDACLRALGVRHVALLVFSHLHADHVGGLDGVLRGRSVAQAVLPTLQEPAAGRSAVLVTLRNVGVPLRFAEKGATYVVGTTRLTVLGPAHPLHGTRSDPNNNSLVIRALVNGRSVLLPGDAETEEQSDLLADLAGEATAPGATGGGPLRVDVLKVAHHGSAFQDPPFLTAAAPAVALVSVGRDNDYGHPNLPLLAQLSRDGARVMRTDLDGDVAVVSDRRGLAVVTHRPAGARSRRQAGGRQAPDERIHPTRWTTIPTMPGPTWAPTAAPTSVKY